jgi:hypothetical protein
MWKLPLFRANSTGNLKENMRNLPKSEHEEFTARGFVYLAGHVLGDHADVSASDLASMRRALVKAVRAVVGPRYFVKRFAALSLCQFVSFHVI